METKLSYNDCMKLSIAISELSGGYYYGDPWDDEQGWMVEIVMMHSEESGIILGNVDNLEDAYSLLDANRFGDEELSKLKAIMNNGIFEVDHVQTIARR